MVERAFGRESLAIPTTISVIKKEHLGTHVIPEGFSVHDLEYVGFPGLVLVCDGEVPEEPIRHEDSDTFYVFDRDTGPNRELFGVHKPGARRHTSEHQHVFSEFYFIYQGALHVHMGENGRVETLVGNLGNPATLTVPQGTWHHGISEGEGTLMYILMQGAALLPRDRQHIKKPKPYSL